MAQDPESTTEVAQVLETTEATAEQEEIAIVPVVSPPETKESSQLEENPQSVEINPDEPRVREETGPPPELEPAEEGPDMENTKQKLTFSSKLKEEEVTGGEATEGGDTGGEAPEGAATEGEAKEVTEGGLREVTEGGLREVTEGGLGELKSAVSQETLRIKLDLERKQRLKDARTHRFRMLPPVVLPQTDDQGEEEEELEDEDREEAPMEEPPVIEPVIWGNIEYPDVEAEGEVDRSPQTLKGPKTKGVFAPVFEGDFDEHDDIFYKDPKYDTEDNESLNIMDVPSFRSLVSCRTIKSMDSLELKSDFLRNFEIPSLSDISEEQEPESWHRLSATSSVGNLSLEDTGHFVDPMTGEAVPSPESSSDFEVDFEGAADPAPQGSSSDLSDIPDLPGFPSAVPQPKPNAVITFDDTFLAMSSHVGVMFEDDDSLQTQVLEREAMVQEFVEDLLSRLVTTYEEQQSENALRLKCDKNKLLDELLRLKDQYIFEKYTNGMLASRLMEYFKRVKNNRAFVQLEPEREIQYYVRYMQALAKVDILKYHLDAVKHQHARQINKVILELHSAQSLASITDERLSQTVRKHLVRPDSEFLHRFVDYALRQMTAKRNEISDMRLILINKKHTQGHLQQKIKVLETLSSTVSIQDYIALQNETMALDKKREERSLELSKMRTQYLMDVHLTHQNREKALALGDKLQLMKITLKSTVQRQRSLRSTLYREKLERTKIREKRKELTFQGGILAMPSLMYEYDHTVQQVKDSQERVSKLKDSVKSLNYRISIAEGRSI